MKSKVKAKSNIMNDRILKLKLQKRKIELENEMQKKAKRTQAIAGGTDSSSGLVVVSAGITTARPLCAKVLQSSERILNLKLQKRKIELENEMRKTAKNTRTIAGGTESASRSGTMVLQSGDVCQKNGDLRLLSDLKVRIQRSRQWRLKMPSTNPTDEQLKRTLNSHL